MERRKKSSSKSTELPLDYAKLVNDVFTTNFDAGLKAIKKITGALPRFNIKGKLFNDEIVLAASLLFEGSLAATTVYASTDFDPKASSPTAQDLLGACVDAAASLFSQLLDPKSKEMIAAVADSSLSSLENIPYDWAKVEIERFKIYLKIDKANIELDSIADQWLAKHDPKAKQEAEEEEEEVEKLFVTGKPPTNTRH